MNTHRETQPAPTDGASSSIQPTVSYRLAKTQSELQQAFSLVRDAYVRVGLHSRNAHCLRITKYHLLPNTKVFIAVARNDGSSACASERVIGTLTVVTDGVLGLPADAVDREKMNYLRRGGTAAEFIALAANDEGSENRVILKLFRLAYEYCRVTGIQTILASLTQRHIGFYRRFLGFKPIGDLKPYEMGNGVPVQVHFLNVCLGHGRIEYRSSALARDASWQQFWRTELDSVLRDAKIARPWTLRLINFFSKKNMELRKQLDRQTVELLNIEYRRYNQKLAAVAS